VSRRPEPLLVLGLVGQYPVAGVAWQAIHYLVGLERLGYEVYYVEDSGAAPYDPRSGGRTDDYGYACGYVADMMRRIGLADRWATLDMARGETYGPAGPRLASLYRDAAVIVNLCGATAPRAEHRQGARLLYIETDPVFEQIRIAEGEETSLNFLSSHDVLFTYGENLGAADSPVPLVRFTWNKTRPPVVPDLWTGPEEPATPFFTSIATWENKGKDIAFRGETYRWSKHVNFLRFLDLPQHTPARLRLAMDPADAAVTARLTGIGWDLVDPRPVSSDLEAYRRFVLDSRGEFTVAKDLYVRPRSGWFSDRSVCYLAAGRPVVTQETGFSKLIPTGEGLFAFSTREEIVDAFARIAADYPRHRAAARRIAAEHFGAEPVLRRLLADAGLG
jgi:hypothetical protein